MPKLEGPSETDWDLASKTAEEVYEKLKEMIDRWAVINNGEKHCGLAMMVVVGAMSAVGSHSAALYMSINAPQVDKAEVFKQVFVAFAEGVQVGIKSQGGDSADYTAAFAEIDEPINDFLKALGDNNRSTGQSV